MTYYNHNFNRKPKRTIPWLAWGIVAVIILFVITPIVVEHALEKTVTFTVQDKAIKRDNSSNSNDDKYMIYTDNGVYEDTDSLAFLKFDSSDVYGQLKIGHTYRCDVTGVRIPFFSMQRNIIDCTEVS